MQPLGIFVFFIILTSLQSQTLSPTTIFLPIFNNFLNINFSWLVIYEVKTLEDTKKLAKFFAQAIDKDGLFVTLTGDIGAGKTQFIRYVLEYLEVEEKITSPSFVILNEYHDGKLPIFHFDLYRLENEGVKTILDELEE